MKNLLFLLVLIIHAANAQWYYGTGEATNLENKIGFDKNTQKIISGATVNPSSVATNGGAGSILLKTDGSLFLKKDAGTTTNWRKILDDSTSSLALDYIDFNTAVTPTMLNGRLHYDQTDKTLTLDVDTANGVSLQVGEEQYIRARNITGSTITDGTVVYITGADSGRPTVSPATTAVTVADKTIGVATQNILTTTEGMITTSGKVGGYNTSGFTAGARLYLTGTGALSMTPPISGIIPVAWALDSQASGNILVDVRSKVDSESLDPTGFTDPSAVTVSYDGATRKVTLTGSFRVLWRGQYVSSLVGGYVSPAHTATNGTWYLYYDGSSVQWSQTPWTFDMVQIAVVNYDGVNNVAVRETHGTMGWLAHKELHDVVGTYVKSGGDFSNYTLASTTAANRRPDISSTTIYDEDLPTINAAHTSKLYTKFFLSGVATGNYTVETADIVPLNGTIPYYNLFTGGNWTQAAMTNNTYQAVFVIAIPASAEANSQKYRYMYVQGQTISSNLGTIQGLAPSDVNLNGLATNIQEIVFIGKIIIQYVGGGTNNWNLVSVQKLVGSKFSQAAVTGGTFLSSVSTDVNYITGSGIVSDPLTIAPAKAALIDSLTGTANYVAKFTGSGVTPSQIFDNGTYVGVGTATATAKLEVAAVNASAGSYAFKAYNSANLPLFVVRNDGGVGIGTTAISNANALTIQRPLSSSIYLISDGGYPGLNNYNYSNVASEQPYSLTYRARGTSTTPLAVLGNDNLGAFGFRGHDGTSFSADVAGIRAYASSDFTPTSRETYMSFYTTTASTTSGAERMRINGAGNMAIGHSAPVARIDVLSAAASSFPATTGTTTAGLIARLRTGGSSSTLDIGGNSTNGSWLQATNNGNLATNYPLLLNPNGGNVGIGNTAPSVKLDVTGDIAVSGYQYFGSPTVDGSFRMFVSGSALVTEKRKAGVWEEVARLDNN